MPMSDQPQPLSLAALAAFHREVMLPDLQRTVGERVASTDRHLSTEIERFWDALLGTREKLEIEYQLIKNGIARLEERLERVEQRLAAGEERG